MGCIVDKKERGGGDYRGGGVGCVQSLYKECGVGGHGLKSVCRWTWFEERVWVDMV